MAFAHDGAAKWPTLRVTIVITVVQKIAIAVAEMDLDQAVTKAGGTAAPPESQLESISEVP
jgi:hypothetical protein